MNYINEFGIEPGTYADEHNNVMVVVDVVNHQYNTTAQLSEAIADPLVVCRHLLSGFPNKADTQKVLDRYAFPLSIFKNLYHKV